MLTDRMEALRKKQRLERLALIRERYRILVLEPRRRLERELAGEFGDELDLDLEAESDFEMN